MQDISQAKRTQVQAQITELLEAFGNAQTTVHANSSRFAKYHEIIFDEKTGKILGCKKLINYSYMYIRISIQLLCKKFYLKWYSIHKSTD